MQSFSEQFDKLSRQFIESYRRGDAKACADLYTADGIKILPGGEVIKGRDAIAADLQRYLDSHYEIIGFTTMTSEANDSIGYATQLMYSPSGDFHVMLALRCDRQGIWRICAEAIVGNST